MDEPGTDPTTTSTTARRLARRPLARRTLAWAIMAVCGALLVATLSEAWTRGNIEGQVTAAEAHNAALRQDVATTRQAVARAQSPDAIERTARSWGYIRPGDHPIIVVVSSTK
jgi:cell division protein FtsB